jgi:succinoglycan biosynthesis protein ExoO
MKAARAAEAAEPAATRLPVEGAARRSLAADAAPAGRRVGRVAVVSLAATFQKRAGNAAYLAALCRVLRRMGFAVEAFFLEPVPQARIHLRQYADYLESVDAVSLRDSVRIGSHFLSRDPQVWAAAGRKALRRVLDRAGGSGSPEQPAASSKVWNLPWPGEAALTWAEQRISAFRPDIVVANYFNASRLFRSLEDRCLKAILVHDVFALRLQSYESTGYPLDFDKKIVEAEEKGFAAADLCLTITEEESDFIRRRHPRVASAVFPFVMPIARAAGSAPVAPRCLFVGSDNDPNRRALAWLLEEVWPKVLSRDPRIGLRIVGNLRRAAAAPPLPGVAFAGIADDLAAEYARASVALVPLRAGSGLKVKLVEALAHGVPVVSTSVGAAGVGSPPARSLQVHDDPAAFADAILAVTASRDWSVLSAGAIDFARARYSEPAAEEALRRVLARAGEGRLPV